MYARALPLAFASVLAVGCAAEDTPDPFGGALGDANRGRSPRDAAVNDASTRAPLPDPEADSGLPVAADMGGGGPDLDAAPMPGPDQGPPPGDCADGDERVCPGGCGVERCAGGAWGDCEQDLAERCNNSDDDCDGRIDETFMGLGLGCTERVDGCVAQGINVCDEGGNGVVCRAEVPEAGPEICDGLDNDCDNTVDEDFPDQRCCTEDIHCPPGDRCEAGQCSGGVPPVGGAACDAPVEMNAFGPYAGDTGGGMSGDSGTCNLLLDVSREVAFQFTLDQAQRVQLDTNGSIIDTVLYVRSECANGFSELACDDDGGIGLASQIQLDAAAGRTYYVFVDGIFGGGPFVLNFAAAPDPGACADDLDCEIGEACVEGRCQPEAPPGCVDDADCAAGEACVAGECRPEGLECEDDFDCEIAEDCVDGACVERPRGCVGDAECMGGRCIDGECVDDPDPPVGGACEAPVEMAMPGVFRGSTDGRDDELGNSCQGNSSGGEQVFEFTLDGPANVTLNTEGSGFDTVLSVRTDCADADTELACSDDAVGTRSRVNFRADAGVTYFAIVDGYNGQDGDVQLDFSLVELPPVCDDAEPGCAGECVGGWCFDAFPAACAGAMHIEGDGAYMADTGGAADAHTPGCGVSASGEAVFALSVQQSGRVELDTVGSAFDTILYVRDACEGEQIDCDDDGAPGLRSRLSFDAEAGRLYYVFVDGFRDAAGAVTLNVTRD